MKVALVRGSSLGNGAYKEFFGVLMPPLGLASLAGAIAPRHDVVLIDALTSNLNAKKIAEQVASVSADMVAVTVTASPYFDFAADLAKRVKAKNSRVYTVAGGHHATFLYPLVLKNGFDFVVLSEGEETFAELTDTLQSNGDVDVVKGLALKRNGKVVVTGKRQLIQSLDSLPMPAFGLLEKKSYGAQIFGPNSYFMTMETSRGCPYGCEFCSVTPMWGRCWRFKGTQRILRELQLVKSLGYNWVFIVDDNFAVESMVNERMLLFKELEKNGLGDMNFIVQIRADFAARNPDFIELASKSGLRIAFLGLESGSDAVLKKMNKGITTSHSLAGIQTLHKNGVVTHGGFVIGAPYESHRELDRTFRYADQLRMAGLDSAQFSIYTPLPGTNAFSKALRGNRLLTLDWKLYDCLHPVMKTRINPLLLSLITGVEHAAFFLKKKAFGVDVNRENCPKQYAELVNTIIDFVYKNLPTYTKETFLVPFKALKLWHRLKKDRTMQSDAAEILSACS